MLLLETIKVEDGVLYNLPYHQARLERSHQALYPYAKPIRLQTLLDNPPSKGLFRCRVLYGATVEGVEYLPYQAKEIQRLTIVPSSLEYHHKYANRDALNSLKASQPQADEIIIEKEGYLTDTTISNIAFFDGSHWYTPHQPLLRGTMREQLLDKGFLLPKAIQTSDISHYTHVALINAMLGFKVIDIQSIQ